MLKKIFHMFLVRLAGLGGLGPAHLQGAVLGTNGVTWAHNFMAWLVIQGQIHRDARSGTLEKLGSYFECNWL